MKGMLAIALMTVLMCSAVSSYAWVCSYRGPHGRVYSSDGGGNGYDAARVSALELCKANKVHNGVSCEFMGCVKGTKY